MIRKLHIYSLAVALSGLAFAQGQPTDHLALGKMWTFENPPLAYLEEEFGFKPDQKWLDSLRLGALRLGERDNPWCSAAFVSPKGLIMTNHHCVRDNVATFGQSIGQPNLVEESFGALALEDERKLKDLTVHQLLRQQDVTDQVNEGIGEDDDDLTVAKKREENIENIKKHADENAPDLMHQVVSLYQGAAYQLYSYKVYDDIRLVLAPHLHTAHFGGDPDNFTFPRWSIDFAFLRAYEDGEPADTRAHYFRWRKHGAQDGELVFVPGNPGSTNRLLTMPQLEFKRDIELPIIHQQLENGLAILRPFAEQIPSLMTTVLGWENSYKAIGGMVAGLRDPDLMQRKASHEKAFREAVTADARSKVAYAGAWDELEKLAELQRYIQPRITFYNASYLPMLDRALAICAAADQELTDEERADALEMLENIDVRRENPITRALLNDHFERAFQWLGAEDPYLKAVAGDQGVNADTDWSAAMERLRETELTDEGIAAMVEGGNEAIEASTDGAMKVARVLYPLMKDIEKQADEAKSAIEVQGSLVGRALHASYGTKVSPDATMTLRFSDGVVSGYEYNGTLAPWATTFYGLYGRSHEFGNEFPFELPGPWTEHMGDIDMKKRVCFASTNDIVGGNSGSCVVDKDLQVVGLIFDGNIESLPNDFYYTQEVARAVSVHTDAIIEAMEQIYNMGRIVEELREASEESGND